MAGVSATSVAHADLSTQPSNTWQTNGSVNAILPVGQTVFIGGSFTEMNDHSGATVTRTNIAAINASTGVPTGWDPNVNGAVFAMTLSPDASTLYVVGSFTKVDGLTRKRIAAFDIATGALLSFKPPNPNKSVRSVATDGSRVYIGGLFTTVGGETRTRLAALDAATGALDPTWTPEANGKVTKLIVDPDRIHAAGSFSRINSLAARGLAALDPGTAALLVTDHTTYPVVDIEAVGSQIFVAGAGPGGRAAAYDRATGTHQWTVSADGNLQGVAASGNFAYFGGHHTKIGGVAAQQFSRLDISTGAVDTSWIPTVNGIKGVLEVATDGPYLYLGGDFNHVSGVAQQGFAQLVDDLVPDAADLSITAGDSNDPVSVGDFVTYTAQVTNIGPATASGAFVTAVLAPRLSFVSSATGCGYAEATREVTCAIGLLDAGSVATVEFMTMATDAGAASNSFTALSDATDPNPADNTAIVETTIDPVLGTADLSVTQTPSPDPVEISSSLSYTVMVSNAGPESAVDVALTDVVPPDAAIQGVSTTGGTCTTSTGVECDLGTMASGASVIITIDMLAPPVPMTVTNSASVSSTSLDPDLFDNTSTALTTVRIDDAGDTQAPTLTSLTMLDSDHDGLVDAIAAAFDEPLAACPAPCTTGWSVTDVPSNGQFTGVDIAGSTATLTIQEGSGDQATAVGSLLVALAPVNTIQDAAGNHPSFGPSTPADGAGPVPTAFRKSNAGINGLAEQGDTLTVEWSELIAPGSFSPTIDVILSDPPGAGDDLLDAPSFLTGLFDTGSDAFIADDGSQAVFGSSTLTVGGIGEVLTLTLGPCSGACSSLTVGPKTAVVYVAPATITDLASNPAVGSYAKTFRLF